MAHFISYDLPPEAKQKISHLRWHIAGNRMLLAAYRLTALLRKANFNPNQPRVPAGSPEGGEWTDGSKRAAAPPVLPVPAHAGV
ncbi:hypothetical protein B4Q13_21440 [Lacticaseibacillus rhamnosus]